MKQGNTAKMKGLLTLTMTIFGTLGLFTRQIPMSSGALALCRAVLAAVMTGIFLLVSKQKVDISAVKRELLLLLLSGAALGINWALLFEAYKYTTISVATLSYYFAPVLVTIVCPVLFREKLSKKQTVCFIMSTLGLILMIGSDGFGGQGTDIVGILYGLGAAVFYATVILMNKAIREVAGIQRTLMQFLGAICVLIPYVVFTDGVRLPQMQTAGWLCLLVVGLVHTGLTYCMYFSAVKELKGQTVAILSYVDPLVALLISFFVFGETMTALQMVGGALILGFTLYNEL